MRVGATLVFALLLLGSVAFVLFLKQREGEHEVRPYKLSY